jgi:hypothetical protein
MKYKPILITFILMILAASSAFTQQAVVTPNRAITPMETKMYACPDLSSLQALYNTLKTDYDRRYFFSGLPAYLADNNIPNAPNWAGVAIVNAFGSNDPLCVYEAVNAAGRLKLSCTSQLMALYKDVHTTFGSHEDMIKSSILGALGGLYDANKALFFNDILTNDHYLLLSASFASLINAMETAKSPIYAKQLSVYSDSLNSLLGRLQAMKEPDFRLRSCKVMLARVNNLMAEIGGN